MGAVSTGLDRATLQLPRGSGAGAGGLSAQSPTSALAWWPWDHVGGEQGRAGAYSGGLLLWCGQFRASGPHSSLVMTCLPPEWQLPCPVSGCALMWPSDRVDVMQWVWFWGSSGVGLVSGQPCPYLVPYL